MSNIYTPLEVGTSEFRLVTLDPGNWEDAINCNVSHGLLDERPSYEALSYAWGDPALIKQICLNGQQFSVTVNLEIALRYLRRETQPRTLWIDALCIDQTNLQERSHQVKRMRDIYTFANSVIAWTGESDQDSVDAFVVMRRLSDFGLKNRLNDLELARLYPDIITLGLRISNRQWKAVFVFGNRPIFRRVWIIQELVSGRSTRGQESGNRCVLRSGHDSLAFSAFETTYLYLLRSGAARLKASYDTPLQASYLTEPFRTSEMGGQTAAEDMLSVLKFCEEIPYLGPLRTIADLMARTRPFLASDSRDKLFAVSGLVESFDALSDQDYTKPPVEIFTALVRSMVKHDGNLDSLNGNRRGINGFGPSWIPDLYGEVNLGLDALRITKTWTALDGTRPDVRSSNTTGFYHARKAWAASGGILPNVRFSDKPKLLHARGLLVGTVTKVIGPLRPVQEYHDPSTYDIFVKTLDEFRQGLRRFAGKLKPARRETFWRTIIADHSFVDPDHPVTPATDEFQALFEVWCDLKPIPDDFKPTLMSWERRLRYCSSFLRSVDMIMTTQCFFTTVCGRMGIGPYRLRPKDVVVILFGGNLPFILRPKGPDYELIGTAYMHGVMKGELFDEAGQVKNGKSQVFTLC